MHDVDMTSTVKEKKLGLDVTYIGVGVGMGIALGVVLGVVMGNVGVGIAIGIVVGAAIGAALSTAKRKDSGHGRVARALCLIGIVMFLGVGIPVLSVAYVISRMSQHELSMGGGMSIVVPILGIPLLVLPAILFVVGIFQGRKGLKVDRSTDVALRWYRISGISLLCVVTLVASACWLLSRSHY